MNLKISWKSIILEECKIDFELAINQPRNFTHMIIFPIDVDILSPTDDHIFKTTVTHPDANSVLQLYGVSSKK